jgi:transposase
LGIPSDREGRWNTVGLSLKSPRFLSNRWGPPHTSDAGEGWSDSQIAAALATSVDTVARTRQRLVEEGLDGALKRHHSPNSARQRIFDGEAEAKLIALTRSPPPKGRARWTLVLLEDQVVERGIVARASDNTIGRTLKKTLSGRT